MTAMELPVGAWAGTNAFRLMPTDATVLAPFSAAVEATDLIGRLTYTWRHATDGEQHGELALAAAEDVDGVPGVVGLWRDTWHQSPHARVLTGTDSGGVVSLGAEYAVGWHWRIDLEPGAGTLTIRMFNQVPDGEPYETMRAELTPLV